MNIIAETRELDVSPIIDESHVNISDCSSGELSREFLFNNSTKENNSNSSNNSGDRIKEDSDDCNESNDDDTISNESDPIAEILYASTEHNEEVNYNQSCNAEKDEEKESNYYHDEIECSEFDSKLQPWLALLTKHITYEYENEEPEQTCEEEHSVNTAIQELFTKMQNEFAKNSSNVNTKDDDNNSDENEHSVNKKSDSEIVSNVNSFTFACAEIDILVRMHWINQLCRELSQSQCNLSIVQLGKMISELALLHDMLPDPVLCRFQEELVSWCAQSDALDSSKLQHANSQWMKRDICKVVMQIKKYISSLKDEIMNATQNLTQRANVITIH